MTRNESFAIFFRTCAKDTLLLWLHNSTNNNIASLIRAELSKRDAVQYGETDQDRHKRTYTH